MPFRWASSQRPYKLRALLPSYLDSCVRPFSKPFLASPRFAVGLYQRNEFYSDFYLGTTILELILLHRCGSQVRGLTKTTPPLEEPMREAVPLAHKSFLQLLRRSTLNNDMGGTTRKQCINGHHVIEHWSADTIQPQQQWDSFGILAIYL